MYNSRNQCKLTFDNNLFFTLDDYRNNMFISNNPREVINFYKGFEFRDQLIDWMMNRPVGRIKIYEVDGDKEIIVVVATADYNGQFARNCKDNMYKGLHMIFVESGSIPDPYFSVSNSVNAGVNKAIKYNPKWIIISSDDLYKIDDISQLSNQLSRIKNNSVKTVFVSSGIYHSKPMYLANPRVSYHLAVKFLSLFSDIWKYREEILKALQKFNGQNVYYTLNEYSVLDKRTSIFDNVKMKLFHSLCFKKIFSFINMLDFVVISGTYANEKGGKILDETFINEMEDTDFSVDMCRNRSNYAFVDFQIGDYIGSSLGNTIARECRVVPGYTYFSEKAEKEYNFISKSS